MLHVVFFRQSCMICCFVVEIMLITRRWEEQWLHYVYFCSTAKAVFIVNGLKNTDIFVGEWATFSCQLSSARAPGKVQWWLDGTLLENSPSCEIGLSQGNIHTLTLKNLATDDSGTVTFKAGSITSTAKLLVKGRTEMSGFFLDPAEIQILVQKTENTSLKNYVEHLPPLWKCVEILFWIKIKTNLSIMTTSQITTESEIFFRICLIEARCDTFCRVSVKSLKSVKRWSASSCMSIIFSDFIICIINNSRYLNAVCSHTT